MTSNSCTRHKSVMVSALPAIEAFLDLSLAYQTWPELVGKNSQLRRQIRARERLSQTLNDVISALPSAAMSLQEAVESHILTQTLVALLYEKLTSLQSSSEYRRVILYTPLEFIPDSNWVPRSRRLQNAIQAYRESFISAWYKLLQTADVRANFVDGDVLDVESRTGDLPRVIKAMHLVPWLVTKELVSVDEVIDLLEEVNSPDLILSFLDTVPALEEMALLSGRHLIRMDTSDNPLLRNIPTNLPNFDKTPDSDQVLDDIDKEHIEGTIQERFEKIDSQEFSGITDKRVAWIKKDQKLQLLNAIGDSLADWLVRDAIQPEDFSPLVGSDSSHHLQRAVAVAIRTAVVKSKDPSEMYDRLHHILDRLYSTTDPGVRNELSTAWHHLNSLGLVEDQHLINLGYTIPVLASPLSANLESIEQDRSKIKEIVAELASHPFLSTCVYPVAMLFGSRLKGYGAQTADIDVGVFIRPGTSTQERDKIKEELRELFQHDKVQGEVNDYWLFEEDGYLKVQDIEHHDPTLGASYNSHVLFGSAWEGDEATIAELRNRLLVPYLYHTDQEVYGHNLHQLCIEELERDTLMYRLMHLGYDRYRPRIKGLNLRFADGMDSQSTFWDSGYRQLAIQLYVSRVFLPKIFK